MASPVPSGRTASDPPTVFELVQVSDIQKEGNSMRKHRGLWKNVNIPLLTSSHVNLICYLAGS